jgi:PRTRC genetic system protein C
VARITNSFVNLQAGRRNNTMKIQVLQREFVYHGTSLADPDPKLSIEEVRSFYANQFPELTTAAISGPETVGDRLRYRFERAIGAKG